jgi:trans-2,3-dihydro-3-hydroxyanthranilate isomerase
VQFGAETTNTIHPKSSLKLDVDHVVVCLQYIGIRKGESMASYNFLQLDVFTSEPLKGNPLAVFPNGDSIPGEIMQAIAREMNLSETVFVVKPNDDRALRRLRIFTPMKELPFAGHPIAGTWFALATLGVVPDVPESTGTVRVTHEVGIGLLPVDIEFQSGLPHRVVMTQGRFEHSEPLTGASEIARICSGLGIRTDGLLPDLPIQVVSTGIKSLAVPVRSAEVLGSITVNSSVLSEAYLAVGAIGCYVFTTDSRDGGAAQARFFAPDDNIPEDPVTGSAAGALSGYLVHHGVISSPDGECSFIIEQGDFMGRPGRVHAQVSGSPGNVSEVRIGGESVIVARGELIF